MPNPVKPIPEGYHTITPSLICRGADGAIDFYKEVFGAKELLPMPNPSGKIGHAELKIGDSIIFVNDEFPQAGASASPGAQAIYLFLYVEDDDTVFNRAVAAGARVDMPVQDMFWGDRYGKLTDPFGHPGALPHIRKTWRLRRSTGGPRRSSRKQPDKAGPSGAGLSPPSGSPCPPTGRGAARYAPTYLPGVSAKPLRIPGRHRCREYARPCRFVLCESEIADSAARYPRGTRHASPRWPRGASRGPVVTLAAPLQIP